MSANRQRSFRIKPSLLTPARKHTRGLRFIDPGAAVWLLPVLIIVLIDFAPKHLVSASTIVALLAAAFVVLIAARWPDRSLILLIVLLPFQGLLLAKLWAWGMPTSIVRHLGAWKEALALGIVIAGGQNFVAAGRRADTLDRLAIGFVLLAAVYVVAQHTILPSAPSSSSVRLLGFRQDAGFVLLLLGARHANLPAKFLDRAGRVAFAVAAVVAAIGIFEALDSTGWNHFIVNTIQYTRYEIGVLHARPVNPSDIRIYGTIGGTQIIRIGSVFLSALSLGFYLVIGFAIGLERAARRNAGPFVMTALLMIVAALLLTQTRSAILGALIVAVLVITPSGTGKAPRTAQLALLLAAIAVVAVPTALATGLSERVVTTSNPDNAGHVANFWTGLNTIVHNPLGEGLGTSAGTGQRVQSLASPVVQSAASPAVVPENNYLEFGIELGALGMLLFIATTVVVIAHLRTAVRRHPHYVVSATGGALAGLAVGAWFLQPWTDFSVAWTVWGLAGAALGTARVRVEENRREEKKRLARRARLRPAWSPRRRPAAV